LRLGAIPSIAPYLLPEALPELQRRFPELNLQLRETITETLVRELISGDLDLILIALPIEDQEIETAYLFDDKFVLAMQTTKGRRQRMRRRTCSFTISSCCWGRGIVFAIRRCRFAALLPPRPGRVLVPRASPPSCRWSRMATASRCCRRWRFQARCITATTSPVTLRQA
jgi:DNA-binding transcriptional LysR family regulator